MAERDAEQQQHAAGGNGAEAHAKDTGHISASDEGKLEETNQRDPEDAASSSAAGETDDNNGGDVVVQSNVKNRDSAGERMPSPTGGSSPAGDGTTLNAEDKNALWADGDHRRQKPEGDQQTKTTEGISSDAPETTSPLILDGKKEDPVCRAGEETPESNTPDADAGEGDLVDGAGAETPESNTPDTDAGEGDLVDGAGAETPESNTPDADAGEADESSQVKEEEVTKWSTISLQRGENVENIGPTPEETADVVPAVVIGNRRGKTLWIAGGLFAFAIAFLWQHLLQIQFPPQKEEVRQIDIFLGQLEKVKTQFPHQRAEFWTRSKIHLARHLQTAQPTEPVSLILTAGRGGERTMRCLAQMLAAAFSSSLNASVLHIDGAGKASEDSDQVKLDIDSKLRGAFEGDQPVAVINRFEELPPGATLIFYRYCDHENAAYKKTCMIFTVLLGEEEEIPAETRLTAVEEMVDDHLQKKFLSEGHPVSFDRMDLDKYGGLWSRISHLILPVAAEQNIERGGC